MTVEGSPQPAARPSDEPLHYSWAAFISYRHSERSRAIAVALEAALRTYGVSRFSYPRRIFRDEETLKRGESLGRAIRSALTSSRFLIYLADRGAAESQWVRQELDMWCRELGRSDRLIVVHVGDSLVFSPETLRIDWARSDALPSMLQTYLHGDTLVTRLDWIETVEDRSLEHPRFKTEVNALAATVEGVTPEKISGTEVRAFHQARRLRRAGITLIVGSLVVIAVLAMTFFRQRNAARRVAAASEIATKALQMRADDRTRALRMAEHAVEVASTRTNRQLLNGWYASGTFYARQLEHPGASVSTLSWTTLGLFVGHGSQATLWKPDQWEAVRLQPRNAATLAVGGNPQTGQLYTLGYGQSISRWKAATGDKIDDFPLWDQVGSAAFSPSGRVAIDTLNGGLVVVDLPSTVLPIDHGVGDRTEAMALSADGQQLALGTETGAAHLVALGSIEVATLETGGAPFRALAFAHDGKTLVGGREDGTALIFDVETREVVERLQGIFTSLSAVAVSSDGRRIALGTVDGRIGIRGRDGSRYRIYQAHRDTVMDLAFSPDDRWLASAGGVDELARVWAAQHLDEPEWTRPGPFETHVCRFSEDGRSLVVQDSPNAVAVWTLDGAPTGRRLEVRGARAGVLRSDGLLAVVNGEILAVEKGGSRLEAQVARPVDLALLARSRAPSLLVLATSKALELRSAELSVVDSRPLDTSPTAMATSRDGEHVALGTSDGGVEVFDARLMRVARFQAHRQRTAALAFSPDGRFIATGSWDETAAVFTLTGKRLASLVGAHDSYVVAVGFSPDGERLLSFDYDLQSQGAIWNWREEYVVRRLTGHGHRGLVADVSTVADQVVTAGMDRTIRLWSMTSTLEAFLASDRIMTFPAQRGGSAR